MPDRTLQCVVVTPERAILDERIDFVALPLYDGELGILPGRTPLIGRLGAGELRLGQGDRARRYFVDGGFAQVRGDVVTVLTPRAIRAEEINATKAQEALTSAQGPVAGDEAQQAQQKAQQRARAQLAIARKSTSTG